MGLQLMFLLSKRFLFVCKFFIANLYDIISAAEDSRPLNDCICLLGKFHEHYITDVKTQAKLAKL